MFIRLSDPYVQQVMAIMSRSLEGFSLPDVPMIEDLDSYKIVFGRWESQLRALYCKPTSLAKFFGGTTITRRKWRTRAVAHHSGQDKDKDNNNLNGGSGDNDNNDDEHSSQKHCLLTLRTR